jgi:hypothetical protein
MVQKAVVLSVVILGLTSCSGTRSASVIPVQSKDKQLSCREVLLEMNEAEEYKKSAEKNKNPDVRSFLAPLGYAYTVTSANEAITASDERIKYLKDVYQISGCENGGTSRKTGLTAEQLKGTTFTSGYPTPTQQQMQTTPYAPAPAPTQQYVPVPQQPQFMQAPQGYAPVAPAPQELKGHTF